MVLDAYYPLPTHKEVYSINRSYGCHIFIISVSVNNGKHLKDIILLTLIYNNDHIISFNITISIIDNISNIYYFIIYII